MTRAQLAPTFVIVLVVLLVAGPVIAAPGGDAGPSSAAAPAAPGEPDDRPPPTFTDEVTVTDAPIVEGSRVDVRGQLVSSVTAEQVEDLNAGDLAAALRRVPGVVVSRYNAVGAYGGGDGGAVYIRGHGSARPGAEIATLVDGIPRFVGVWTHPLLDTLSVDPAERIDVYRSTQPVLLGNMSFGAVDLVSKRWRGDDGFGGRLVGSLGELDTVTGRVEAGGAAGDLDWYLVGSHRSSDGHRENADGEVNAAYGRFGWRPAPGWGVSLAVHHTDGWANDPRAVGAPSIPVVERFETDGQLAIATVTRRHEGGHGRVQLYLDESGIDWHQWDGVAGEPYRTLTDTSNWGVRLRETVAPWDGGELVVGLDHDVYGGHTWQARADGGRRADVDLHFRSTAPYAFLSHTFGDEVQVTPSVGVRWADTRYFDDQWGAQAGLRVSTGGLDLYANAARGYNLPGVWSAVLYGTFGRGDDWRQLDAETIEHLEVGAVWRMSPRARVELSLYSDDVSDALRFVPPPPPPPGFANVGDYTVRGVEAAVHVVLARTVTAFLGGTWSDPDPAEVPNVPETTAVAGVTWQTPSGWGVSAGLEWLDDQLTYGTRFPGPLQAIDGYALVSARGTVPLGGWLPVGGSLFVAGDNLGDESYEYRPGYPMPGRTWTVGLDLRF